MSITILVLTSIDFLTEDPSAGDNIKTLRQHGVETFIGTSERLDPKITSLLQSKGLDGFYYGGLSDTEVQDLFIHLAEMRGVGLDNIAVLGTDDSVLKYKKFVRLVAHAPASEGLTQFTPFLVKDRIVLEKEVSNE